MLRSRFFPYFERERTLVVKHLSVSANWQEFRFEPDPRRGAKLEDSIGGQGMVSTSPI
jgi:hypothetical protein